MMKLTIVAMVLAGGITALPAVAGDGSAAILAKAKAAVATRDYAAVFKLLQPVAEAGDPAAEVRFGNLYYDGTGVPRDRATAIAWYQKAADQGNAEGEALVGDAYLYGKGKPQDFASALAWYHKAADQDDYEAQDSLAWVYGWGSGVELDKTSSEAWSEKALSNVTRRAEAGDAEAQTELGWRLEDGAAARTWFEKAAAQNYVPAEEALAEFYDHFGQAAFRNEGLADHWYRKAAEDGNTDAQSHIADMYDCDGAPKDAATSLKWRTLAAEGGSAWDQYELSKAYRDGACAAENDSEAVKWLREAAEGDVDDAQMELAERYASGDGLARDLDLSIKWYVRAALNWDGEAQYRLGMVYTGGDGVTADPVEAYKWFTIALANEHAAYGDVPDKAAKARDAIGSGMSAAQIAQAEAEAKAFRPSWPAPPTIHPRVTAPQAVSGADAKE